MSEAEWTFVSKPNVPNKWEDEEESDDLKENWDDEDEEPKSTASEKAKDEKPAQPAAKSHKKGKALKAKIAEKEAEAQRPRTKEELLAEKLKNQRLQEESDLALAKEAIGGNAMSTTGLDSIELNTRADYDAFRQALSNKLAMYNRSPYFVPFLEELFRDVVSPLDADDVKKLDTILTTVFNEKIKLQKQEKPGKKKKKAAAHTIQMERDDDYSYNQGNQGYDEYEDFL